jgi:mRNA interferase MazF
MSFSIGDVILLPIPFTDLTSRKVRPAVVIGLSTHSGDLFVVPISSQAANVDFLIEEWQGAGLNIACGIKSQIATVERALVVKRIGKLQAVDRNQLQARLREWLRI